MTDIEGPDWHKIGAFAEEHWPYLVVGLVVLVGIFYTMSGSSGAATTATSNPGGLSDASYAAQLAAFTATSGQAAQLQAVQIAGEVQTTVAQIQAGAVVQQANAAAASAAIISGNSSLTSVANYAAQTTAGQNIQAIQSLATGFSNYAAATAQQTAADASGAAGVVTANDQTAGRTLAAGIGMAGLIMAGINGAGQFGNLSPGFTGGYNMLPNVGMQPVVTNSGYGSPGGMMPINTLPGSGYIDSGNWTTN